MRSFKSSEHIFEKGDGPYRGFGYSSLVSDPLDLATWSQRKLQYFLNFQQANSKIKMGPNILNLHHNPCISGDHTSRVVGWAGPLGRKEIDGLFVPPGKAHTLLTDHLITG